MPQIAEAKKISKSLIKSLPGSANFQVRAVYYALLKHYERTQHQEEKCPFCTSYPQYGVLIVRGDFLLHLTEIAGSKCNKMDLDILCNKKIIELVDITPRTKRVTFVLLAPR